MKSLLFLLCLLALSFQVPAQFFDSLSAPRAWYRADKGEILSTSWRDVSGNQRDGTALVNQMPLPGAMLNFNKTVFFDGIDDYLSVPVNLEKATDFTIISVFRSADTTERGIWGTENAVARRVMLSTRQSQGPDTVFERYGRNERFAALSAVTQSWESAANPSATGFLALGSAGRTRTTKPFKGEIAEALVFDRAITFLERLQVETYLALKYGTSTRRNYISSGGKILWNAEENAAYQNRISGLGHDQGFELNQKQSGSAYDSAFVVISIGALAPSNDDNGGTLNVGDFLIWGDNNKSRRTVAGQGKDSVLALVERRWLITATGATASQIATQLYVDQSRLPKTTQGYWLVVDRSGLGNFSVDNLEYVLPDRITPDGKAVYKIQWDVDGSGKDAFGFARARSLFGVVETLNNPTCVSEINGRVRVEMIAGQAPYSYVLTGGDNKMSREGKFSGTIFEQKDLTRGAYSLTLSDGSGDKLVRQFDLIMYDGLNIDLGPDRRLTPGGEVIVDIKSQVPDSVAVRYEWESNFGYRGEGSKVNITESGIYRVTVTKQSDGCAFSDEFIVSGSEEQRVVVFPTIIERGEVYNISISMPEPGGVQVQVVDMKGMVSQTLTGQNNSEYHFKASLLNSGMYLIMIRTPRGSESRKVIVN